MVPRFLTQNSVFKHLFYSIWMFIDTLQTRSGGLGEAEPQEPAKLRANILVYEMQILLIVGLLWDKSK
jgi:hypothetical protein